MPRAVRVVLNEQWKYPNQIEVYDNFDKNFPVTPHEVRAWSPVQRWYWYFAFPIKTLGEYRWQAHWKKDLCLQLGKSLQRVTTPTNPRGRIPEGDAVAYILDKADDAYNAQFTGITRGDLDQLRLVGLLDEAWHKHFVQRALSQQTPVTTLYAYPSERRG